MNKITRRLFLRNSALAGAVSTMVAAPAAAAPVAATDPLADAICMYREKVAEFCAIPGDQITMENEADIVARTYGPIADTLWNETPKTTSTRGVAEAIRYALETDEICSDSAVRILQSALAFLDA